MREWRARWSRALRTRTVPPRTHVLRPPHMYEIWGPCGKSAEHLPSKPGPNFPSASLLACPGHAARFFQAKTASWRPHMCISVVYYHARGAADHVLKFWVGQDDSPLATYPQQAGKGPNSPYNLHNCFHHFPKSALRAPCLSSHNTIK